MLLSLYVLFYLKKNGYVKYFDNGGKNMSFITDDKKVYEKYDEEYGM